MDSLESCIRGDQRLAWPWFPRTLEFGAESPASWKPSQSGHTPGPGGWHLRTGEKHGGLLFCPSAGSCSLPGLGHQAAEQPPRLRAPAAFCCLCFCLTPGRNALGPQCAEGQGLDGDLSRRTEQQGKGAEFAAKTPPCLPPTVGPTHPTVPGHCRRLSSPRWLQCLARQKGLGDSGVEDPSPSVAPHPAS